MLKLWGRLSSINVRKVVLTAQLLNLPLQRINTGAAFGVTRTEDYLACNPNGLVPLLEDDGFVLWESNTIVRHLCAKHSLGGLYPQDLHPRFDAERWMDWQQTTLNGAGRDAFIQLERTPSAPAARPYSNKISVAKLRGSVLPLAAVPVALTSTTARLLAALPAGVVLSAAGLVSPLPLA